MHIEKLERCPECGAWLSQAEYDWQACGCGWGPFAVPSSKKPRKAVEGDDGRIVLVCGGRDYSDRERVFAVLDAEHDEAPIDVIVHGNSRGADMHAEAWAQQRGVHTARVQARWESRYNKRAGLVRNRVMSRLGPVLCIAFPGGRGTAHMVGLMRAAGVPVLEPRP